MEFKDLETEQKAHCWHYVVSTATGPRVYIYALFSLDGVQSYHYIENNQNYNYEDGEVPKLLLFRVVVIE